MATTISTLKFMITADAGGLVEGVALTKRELREASKIAEDARSPFQQYGDKLDRLKMLHAGGGLDAAQYRQALNGVHQEMLSGIPIVGRFAGLLTPGGAVTAGLAAGAAGFLALSGAVAAAGAVVSSRISAIDDMADAAERLGISAASLSTLKGAAFLGDVDPNAVDGALQKMLVNLGKESKAITDLGLNVDTLKTKGTAQVFEEIAGAISRLPNKSDQFAAMTEIFGKSGPEISNLVNKFAELQEAALASGAVVGEQLSTAVSEADDAMKRASMTAEGWANVLTAVVVPAVTATVDAMNEMASQRQGPGVAFGGTLGMAGGIAGGMLPFGLGAAANAGGQLAGNAMADAMFDLRDAMIENARLSRELKDTQEASALAAAEITKEEKKLDKVESDRFSKVEAMGTQLWQQVELIGKSADEAARMRAEFAGATADETEHIQWLAKELELRKEAEKTEKAIRDSRVKNAIGEIDEAERIKDSLKSDEEKARERIDRARELEVGGLLGPKDVESIIRREASGLLGSRQDGITSATKGTSAARQAVIESGAMARQQKSLDEMVSHLKKIADKKATELELVRGP